MKNTFVEETRNYTTETHECECEGGGSTQHFLLRAATSIVIDSHSDLIDVAEATKHKLKATSTAAGCTMVAVVTRVSARGQRFLLGLASGACVCSAYGQEGAFKGNWLPVGMRVLPRSCSVAEM